MIASMQNRMRGAVAAALGEIFDEVNEDHLGWRGRCADGFGLSAVLEDEWLRLRAPFAQDRIHGQAVGRCAWEVLLRNGILPGAAKLAIGPDRAVVYATLEMVLDRKAAARMGGGVDDRLTAQLGAAVDDLRRATRRHPNGEDAAARRRDVPAAVDLAALCGAAGWAFNRRNERRVTVQLETAHGYAQAILDWGGELRATVQLCRAEHGLRAASRQAIGVMLLQLGGLVRAVRPAALTGSGCDVVVLQACLGADPSARELGCALEVLSVGAGMCQCEVGLLADEALSNRYLSVCGWSASREVRE